MRRVPVAPKSTTIPVLWSVREGGTNWSKTLAMFWDERAAECYLSELGGECGGNWIAVAQTITEGESNPYAGLIIGEPA